MSMFHRDAPSGDIHKIHQWAYGDATARTTATGLTSSDIGKVALQVDTSTYWILTNNSPLTWQLLGEVTSANLIASNISNTPSGNLSGANVQLALNELQSDIDTRATSAALTAHTSATSAHGVTGAVVGTTDAQTLTNKTLTDSSTAIADATDATKQIKFDAAGTTATSTTLLGSQTANRTLTLPDATDTLVGRATTDTLTNKTLTSPVINTPTGIVKGDVGLGNVDNTSDATKNSATATLTNKTVGDSLIFTQVTTPSAPGSGATRVYAKSDGKLYYYPNGGAETAIGSGGAGGGAKNYITYKDFENNAATGWHVMNVALTSGVPSAAPTISATNAVDATTASSISTFGTTATNPLAGAYSLQTASSAAWSAGQGFISDALTIDREDRAKILSFKASYEITAGATNLNLSGTTSNTFAVYIYQYNGTSWTWTQPSGVFTINSTAIGAITAGSFQSNSDTTQIRIAIVAINASAGAATINWDDFSVGPDSRVMGAYVGDWQTYTPSITGATTNPTIGTNTMEARWRKVGDSAEIAFSLAQSSAGTAGSGTYRFSLPAGLAVDTTKLSVSPNTTGLYDAGSAYVWDGTVGYTGYVYPGGTTWLELVVGNTGATLAQNFASSTISFANTNVRVTFRARIPIAGWGTSMQLSSDSSEGRVVATRVVNVSSTSVTNGSTVLFSTVKRDELGEYSGGVYTAKISGWRRFTVGLTPTGASVFQISIAGVSTRIIQTPSFLYGNGSTTQWMNAGDTAFVTNNSGSTITLTAGDDLNQFCVERTSGNQTLAASESVNASYWISAASFTGSTTVPFNFDSKEYDSHNAVTTSSTAWRFTAPISGLYNIAMFAIGNVVSGYYLRLYKNGAYYKPIGYITQANNGSPQGNGRIKLNAGEYIDLRPHTSITLTGGTLATDAISTVSIERVGN